MEGVAMKDLLIELQEVTDWLYLGVCLGVPESKLKEIRCDYEDVEDRKREMLSSWMEKEIPTWSKVIKALAEIGMHKLAIAIASKYGRFCMHRTAVSHVSLVHHSPLFHSSR